MATFNPRANSRAQLVFWSSTVFVCCVLLSQYSRSKSWSFSLGQKTLLPITAPLEHIAVDLRSRMLNSLENFKSLQEQILRNEQLSAELSRLNVENTLLKEREHENKELRALLQVKNKQANNGQGSNNQGAAITIANAKILQWDIRPFRHSVYLDQGSDAGVKVADAVLTSQGILGQVIAVGPSTSRVLLISDKLSAVDVFTQTSRIHGVLIGDGSIRNMAVPSHLQPIVNRATAGAELSYVLAEEAAQITAGELLVTSGLDGVFPAGLVVGVINEKRERSHNFTESMFSAFSVTLSNTGSATENALVMRPLAVDVQDNQKQEVK